MELWLAGYGAWPAPKRAEMLVSALKLRGVTRLVDARISPCASDIVPGRPYGPKPWNLQVGLDGIAGLLAAAEIGYTWLVELGNPQRHDPEMKVLKSQIADELVEWPVHRGLAILAEMLRDGHDTIALLCACADGKSCHRTVVAEALNRRHFGGKIQICELV